MQKIVEFFDIDRILELRQEYLSVGLDDKDNFSYHIALTEDGIVQGTGRLYRQELNSKTIIIDCIAVGSERNHRELIFRSLLLKCFYIDCEVVIAKIETSPEYYEKFNLKRQGESFSANLKDIVFPKECNRCK